MTAFLVPFCSPGKICSTWLNRDCLWVTTTDQAQLWSRLGVAAGKQQQLCAKLFA